MPNTKPKRPNTYWRRLDFLYKNNSKKDMFELIKKEVSKNKLVYEKKDSRGRKPKFLLEEYVAFLVLQKIFGHAYREMELEAELYLPDKVDHSTLARNFAKISEEYLEQLAVSFVNKEFSFWLGDSTGISTKIRVERIRQGIRNKTKLTEKYHVILGYDPSTGETMILAVKASDNRLSDSKAAQEMIKELLKGKKVYAWFLADSAYNTYALHEILEEHGLEAQIKPDNKGISKKMSVKARKIKLFKKRLYKEVRGVVETVFGGATNAGLILTRSKKTHTRRLDTLILAVRHNLFANLKTCLLTIIVRQTRLIV